MAEKKKRPKVSEGEAKQGEGLPTPHDVRTARKAQLVEWCQELGLDPEGKVDDLRERLLAYLEEREEAEEAPEEVKGEEVGEGVEAPAEGEVLEAPEGQALEIPEGEEAVAIEELEGEYVAKAKPSLDDATRTLLEIRNALNRHRPTFLRQEWHRYKRLGMKWRRPRGIDSKARRRFISRGSQPAIGWRGPAAVRGLHPSGFREVIVHRIADLEGVDPGTQAIRIARTVGTRKRLEIQTKAKEKGIRVLNLLREG
jgi:large subunit ribosomal protein L32e